VIGHSHGSRELYSTRAMLIVDILPNSVSKKWRFNRISNTIGIILACGLASTLQQQEGINWSWPTRNTPYHSTIFRQAEHIVQ